MESPSPLVPASGHGGRVPLPSPVCRYVRTDGVRWSLSPPATAILGCAPARVQTNHSSFFGDAPVLDVCLKFADL